MTTTPSGRQQKRRDFSARVRKTVGELFGARRSARFIVRRFDSGEELVPFVIFAGTGWATGRRKADHLRSASGSLRDSELQIRRRLHKSKLLAVTIDLRFNAEGQNELWIRVAKVHVRNERKGL